MPRPYCCHASIRGAGHLGAGSPKLRVLGFNTKAPPLPPKHLKEPTPSSSPLGTALVGCRAVRRRQSLSMSVCLAKHYCSCSYTICRPHISGGIKFAQWREHVDTRATEQQCCSSVVERSLQQ